MSGVPEPVRREQPQVTAIVVSWNTRDLLVECLTSLRQAATNDPTLEVVVVDNASTDDSVETVRRDFPEVQLIANDKNVGFQRANNQALPLCHGAALLLINADARLTPGCLERMLEYLWRDPRCGAVGPRLVYGDGRWQRWTAGRDPSVPSAAAYYLGLERLWPDARFGRGVYLGRDTHTAFQPDWVSSACMLVRRAALDQVGFMDERFFAYMDDVDLCHRLRATGWNIWYVPQAEAVHHMGQSTRRQTGNVSPLALRSFNRYFELRHGSAATTLLRLMQAAGFGARAALYLALSSCRAPNTGMRERARAHWSYFKVSLEAPLGT